jgi:alkyl hydroperoxide reductase subunit AhpC
MKINKNIIIVCSLFVASILSFSTKAQDTTASSAAKKMFTVKTLPAITLSDINGKKVNVADLGKTGKITVFSFWATWCIPCKKELTEIDKVYGDWQKKYNLDLVAVSTDDARNSSKVITYVNGEAWDYKVLLDVNSDLSRALGVQSVPYTLLVDQKGNIVYVHSGYVEGAELELEKEIAKLMP